MEKSSGRVAELAYLPDVPKAPMLELADKHASEACARKSVRVQLPLGALWQAGAHGWFPAKRDTRPP